MATSTGQVDFWLKCASEPQKLAFKEAKRQIDSKYLFKYCVAIANEGGGKLVLGVTNQPPRSVVGTNALRNPVEMAEKTYQKLGFRVDIEEVQHRDGRIVVLHIPSRPRGTPFHFEGVYLIRVGQALSPMSEGQLRQIFSEGSRNWLEEPSVTGLCSQDVIELLDTQTYFELLKRPYPTEQSGVIEQLINDKLIDALNSSYSIRRLGGLLLARRLDKFADLARKAPRVVVYSDTAKFETRLDHTSTRGIVVGYQTLVDFVASQIPQKEVIENAIRRETKMFPIFTVRELLANALIHQDLSIAGTSMMVEIYSNRVEISNPGEPAVPIERFIDGSHSRNEQLATMMRRLGICEEKSSGIDKVIREAEIYQMPAPYFHTGYQRTIVTIYGSKEFEDMDRNDRIRACYQHCALKRVMSDWMTNQSLRKRFGLDEDKSAVISQVIAATANENLIKLDEQVGKSRRLARYLPFWA